MFPEFDIQWTGKEWEVKVRHRGKHKNTQKFVTLGDVTEFIESHAPKKEI
jgi:hypothetical protein